MKKTTFLLTLLATSLLAQTQLIIQPGITVIPTNAFNWQVPVIGTNNGALAIHMKVYDASDPAQFSLVTNVVDVVAKGEGFHAPRLVTTNSAIATRRIPTNGLAKIFGYHFTNEYCVIWSDGVLPTSLTLSNQ
jgi:hypothetical protein